MVPEKYFDNLTIFANRLDYLAWQKIWSDSDLGPAQLGNTDQNWSNLLQALPAKLRF
jgi:hypothetical protein